MMEDGFYVSNNGALVGDPYENAKSAASAALALVNDGWSSCAWVEKVAYGAILAWNERAHNWASANTVKP